MLRDLVERTRSIRRFHETEAVGLDLLRNLVELTRFIPSRANAQPLKYVLSASLAMNARIFRTLSWFGMDSSWRGPAEGDRPSGYIVIVLDTHLWNDAWSEAAIAAHTILLGATEAGLGGSLVTGVDRARLKAELQLSDRYNVLVVVALGRPKEDVRVASTSPTQELRRYRDDSGTAFVPKRSLNELILADLPRES